MRTMVMACVLLGSLGLAQAADITITTSPAQDTALQRLTEESETVAQLVQRHAAAMIGQLLAEAQRREQAEVEQRYRQASSAEREQVRTLLNLPQRR